MYPEDTIRGVGYTFDPKTLLDVDLYQGDISLAGSGPTGTLGVRANVRIGNTDTTPSCMPHDAASEDLRLLFLRRIFNAHMAPSTEREVPLVKTTIKRRGGVTIHCLYSATMSFNPCKLPHEETTNL